MSEPVRHPRPKGYLLIVSIALLIGIGALGLSISNAVDLGHQADQRNADRIASDLAGCARGNIFRQQVIDQAHAVDALIEGILDAAFTPRAGTDTERAAAIAAFRARLDAPLIAYRNATSKIRLVDCKAVTPGANDPD